MEPVIEDYTPERNISSAYPASEVPTSSARNDLPFPGFDDSLIQKR